MSEARDAIPSIANTDAEWEPDKREVPPELADAADQIEHRLHPDVVAAIITWRDTELGRFEEEDVKRAGKQAI